MVLDVFLVKFKKAREQKFLNWFKKILARIGTGHGPYWKYFWSPTGNRDFMGFLASMKNCTPGSGLVTKSDSDAHELITMLGQMP